MNKEKGLCIFNRVMHKIIVHFIENKKTTDRKEYYANASAIAKAIGVSHVTISKYLKMLHTEGILDLYIFGTNHIYRLADTTVTQAIVALLKVIDEYENVNSNDYKIECMQT